VLIVLESFNTLDDNHMIDKSTEEAMKEKAILLEVMDSVYYPNDPTNTYFEAMLQYVGEDTPKPTIKMLEKVIVIDNHQVTYNNIVATIHDCFKIWNYEAV
jgi:hypothetical protein